MSGPQFLFLYLLLAIAANLGLRWYFRRREAAMDAPAFELSQDPYEIAFLRSGTQEAIKVAVVSLIDRKLLLEEAGIIRPANSDAVQLVRRPLERAILRASSEGILPRGLLGEQAVLRACCEYEETLGARGLVADARIRAKRRGPFIAASAIMLGIAGARIANALMHGRHNIDFLIVLTAATVYGLWRAYGRHRTGAGDEALAKLRTLFADLERRAPSIAPGGASADAVLLAAVFGIQALPADIFPDEDQLFPKSKDGGGCGGGGCGGGGCGGGCGG